ncbi:MAG: MBL fold metallo-hydrolase [Euryarchaeota archaeon]|nr:MBL fold metallo-hydrolase [Euryarchaeota archaeon]
MKAKFLGGASKVGSLGMVLDTGTERLLFDYGLTPDEPPGFPMKAPKVDAAFVTHAHVDHSGAIPWLCSVQQPDIYATPPTAEIGAMLMDDTIKVAESEGRHLPFGKMHVQTARRLFKYIDYGESAEVGETEVTAHDAGHIPGASSFEISGDHSVLFTGDIHTIETNLVNGARPVKCDTLVIESTYAGRYHPNRLKTEHAFVSKVEEVVDRGGMAIVPAFAVGRTQEIIMLLMHSHRDMWLDGMGKRVNLAYLDMQEYLISPKRLRKAMHRFRPVRNYGERRKAMGAQVVVTTSGMLDGGPVLSYLDSLKNDTNSAILLTGYQVEGTNGRLLHDEGMVEFYGVKQKINCEVEFYDLSAHADHGQLLKFIKACDPTKIVLMHGEERAALAKDLEEYEVIMPMEGEEFDL